MRTIRSDKSNIIGVWHKSDNISIGYDNGFRGESVQPDSDVYYDYGR